MKSVWGLFLVLLFFLGFFGFQYIPLFGIRFFSILLLIILYFKGSKVKGKYNFANSIINYFVLIAGLGISSYAIREGARIRDNKYELTNFINQVYSISAISTLISLIL